MLTVKFFIIQPRDHAAPSTETRKHDSQELLAKRIKCNLSGPEYFIPANTNLHLRHRVRMLRTIASEKKHNGFETAQIQMIYAMSIPCVRFVI